MAVEPQLWIDGRPASGPDLHALALLSYGAVTAFAWADGGVRGWHLHMERLADSARELFQLGIEESRIIRDLRLALDGVDEAWVRVILVAPGMSLRQPEMIDRLSVVISVAPPASPLPDGLRLMSVPHTRELAHLKHLGTGGIIHARRTARLAGFDDALLTGSQGEVLEGTLWNIGLLRQGQVVWPRGPILDGTTRRLIADGLTRLGVRQSVETISLGDLSQFEGAFVCNASTPAAIIQSIDDIEFSFDPEAFGLVRRAWEDHPVTRP